MRWAFCVLVSMLIARTVGAQPATTAKPIPVFESHQGKRPSNIVKMMAALQDQLETRGLAARPASVMLLTGDAAPRPGISDPDLTFAKIIAHMNAAWLRFVNAEWKEAEQEAKLALTEVDENPELLVTDTSHLDLKFKLMIMRMVALDHLPQRSAEVSVAATEAIRVFPARAPGRSETWGKRGEELHAEYFKQAQTYGRGMLVVAAGNPVAQIFIEGQLRGVGNVSLNDLIPGVYNVYLLVPNGLSLRYRVRVTANSTSYLTARPAIDGCLHLGKTWTGLSSCDEEGKVATTLAEEWTGRDQAVVLRSGENNGRPTITGILYRGGKEKRNARIYADADDQSEAEKLAAFLVDGEEAPGLSVQKNDRAPSETREGGRVGAPSSLWPKLVLGTGGAVMAGSVALYLASPDDDHLQPEYDDKKSLAVEVFAGAAVVTGVGVYGWLTTSRHMRRLPAAMFSVSAAAILTTAMFIPTDEDPQALPAGYWTRKSYRDTAPAGVALAGVSVGFAVAGYLTLRYSGESATPPTTATAANARVIDGVPVVSTTREGVTFGWAGSF